MKRGSLVLAAALVIAPGAAMAQAKPAPSPPASTGGTADAKTRLNTLHYNNVQGLRRGPDGQWTGKATQGGVQKQVTVTPQGKVIAR
ncbi:MAG: hypothetical protein AB7F22_08230 [Reyranella sp.]|uniref:hypothetical protein n=1 Tax=Reyranella sp. TaxID=1929291 RepID=UPI003D0A362F